MVARLSSQACSLVVIVAAACVSFMSAAASAIISTAATARTDVAVIEELLRAVEPLAIDAALEAERMHLEGEAQRRQMVELDLQQARYEASLAERRYAACDPDNRLIAAQLEKSWEATLRRVEACEARLNERQVREDAAMPDFAGLAHDLKAAWNAPDVDMRFRHRLLRALVKDIVATVDNDGQEVELTIHWQGGQHSQVRIRKPKTGEHTKRTPEEAMAIIRSMAALKAPCRAVMSCRLCICGRTRCRS